MLPDPPTTPAPSELQRLEQCVREPIRTPGRIQSHGILFAWNKITARIDVVSENVVSWLGHPIEALGSSSLEWSVTSGAHSDPVRVDVEGEAYDAIVHEVGDRVIVELERHADREDFPSTSVMGAIRALGEVDSADELRQLAAEELRAITGFDRVMVYRFFPDGHGEVAGESAAEGMEAYRGLRFPASDIPQQARSLYITKLSRTIGSTTDPGLGLLSSDEGGEPLDLSDAELRAVSPHHLEFMRNMGQESTVSFSLVHDGRLIGMITCAHRTPRRVPVLLRRALEVLASQLTLQIVALESIARLRRELDAREQRRVLLTPVAGAFDPLDALLTGPGSLLELVGADGAILRVGDISKSVGFTPDADRSELLDAVGIEPFATDALPATHPGLSALLPGVGGLLVVPVGLHGVAIFLRREVTQVIRWLGDQSDENRDTPLSPRRSFSAWSQSVSGTALPWDHVVEEARIFGREFAETLDRRDSARLAELALIDPLTGLQNRRSLLDRLEKAIAREQSGCLMFLDLDRFKSVNDRFGHETGDIVLRAVAGRLSSISRATDTVARLGGDEFVVLCIGVGAQAEEFVARRMVEEVGQPIAIGAGREIVVTVSCGVVPLDATRSPDVLLDAADAAMYRAKNSGRNRASL
jgi:two-component system, chemotaxis family, sensor kinase Cph1